VAQSAVSRLGNRCIVGLAAFLACTALTRAALAIDDLLSEPTPLILKDGRIAQVSVHTIPFATGSGELDAEAAAELDALLVPLATDCFLTAQAIGHVEPGLNRDGDTLSAHRLARARADFVQAALAGHGMQLAAVASVWDWQFLVKESRVTLWVFRLNVGDDCEGTPLPSDLPVAAAAAPVVDAVSPPAAAAPAPVKPPAKSPPPAEKSSTVATNGVATTDPRELSTAEAPPPATAAAAATPAPAIEPPAPAVEPPAVMAEAKEPAPVEAPAPVAPAAEPEPIEVAAPLPATADSPPAPVAELPGPAIVFAVNSSFFSGSASRDLRAFVDQLPPDAEVEIELAAAVGTGDVRDADPVEAKRYNAWMAERRLQRVAEWLTSNAGPRQLKLNEHYIENDPSREVRLRARVLP
jgi:hypothetical protein